MKIFDLVLMWVSLLLPLATTLFCFVYGMANFFKKKKPLFVQSLTMAMGCYALGSVYRLCLALSTDRVIEGFTPMYLGHIGMFLFFITASYGQLDRIIDDRSKETLPARIIAFAAPLGAGLLYVPNVMHDGLSVMTKITYALVWIPAMISVYFLLKHALIPNHDFEFTDAIRPYNVFALCLGFSELICLTTWSYLRSVSMALAAVTLSVFCILTVLSAKKGVDKWII